MHLQNCVRGSAKNKLSEDNRKKILDAFSKREDIEYFAKLVDNKDIAENEYTISVSNYVIAEDTREVVDIKVLNAEIEQIVEKQSKLRISIDEIIREIENK